METVEYDSDGKVEMHGIYDQIEPTAYFTTLCKLDYSIPQAAKPMFSRIIEARRRLTGSRRLKLVDIGCSYGVNAALLKHGLSMQELYRLYTDEAAEDRSELLERDRELFGHPADEELEFVGVDQARNAIAYAVDAGTLDAGIATDLETHEPNAADRKALEGADLIISTGCFGYVTETSLERLLDAAGDSRPWMAHFVLRMFDFQEAEAMLKRHGYVSEKAEGLFRQRRFASQEERDSVMHNLGLRGVDPAGAEDTGWYYAELHVARPVEEVREMPLARLLAGAEPALAM